jgi:hypothetical protein
MQMKSGGLSVLLIAFSGNSNVNDVKVCSERVTGSRTYQAVRDLLDLRIARYPHLGGAQLIQRISVAFWDFAWICS